MAEAAIILVAGGYGGDGSEPRCVGAEAAIIACAGWCESDWRCDFTFCDWLNSGMKTEWKFFASFFQKRRVLAVRGNGRRWPC